MFSITDQSSRYYIPNMSRLSIQRAGPQGIVEFNCILSSITFKYPLIPLGEGSSYKHTLAILERLDVAIQKGAELGLNPVECQRLTDLPSTGAMNSNITRLHAELMQNRFAKALNILLSPSRRSLSEDRRVQVTLRPLRQQWQAEYQGTSLSAFKELLSFNQQLWDSAQDKYYAKSVNIIQSSGIGKSRLISEYTKGDFTIIYTLRTEGEIGYPPGDTEVTSFLRSSVKTMLNTHKISSTALRDI